MMELKNPIIPAKQQFASSNGPKELDFKAICIFAATGFFLDSDTYWKNRTCLGPGQKHWLDEQGKLINSEPYFQWHYDPGSHSFEQALEEYTALLTNITRNQVKDHPVILPLSGGLDSRSQALVLKGLDNPVHAYSYSFLDGYPEHKISKKIAEQCGFSFESFIIPKGYLWSSIDDLAQINSCYSEFTHPRQMAILEDLKAIQGVFSLGHWGDVLFDRGVPEGTQEDEVMELLLYKMVKKGGMDLANKLWKTWDLEGDFKSYLVGRIETALSKINIDNLSAKIRAFKTSQWAHRWTTTNLSIFEAAHPITLPYYDDAMCQFVCRTNEDFLADRKLQIAHLKQSPELAKITWHANKPFNLYNYHLNRSPINLPYRILNKIKRVVDEKRGHKYIQRNWELQFLGSDNDKLLKERIFSEDFYEFIPKEIIKDIYHNFTNKDQVYYSHPLSMLLTFSLWNEHFYTP
ncbi:MAG: asparagine synthetase B family protein [Saprospiraceae bacterium]|nr:asparagine synthetase B family protein [Saprospiraceae bacterium]